MYSIAKDLTKAGVKVSITIGGDGCQGSPSQAGDLIHLSDEVIIAGFENLIKQTGV